MPTATTPDGHKVGWDICGNPVCNRHAKTKAPGCPKHPVVPAYLQRPMPPSTFQKRTAVTDE